MKKYYSYGDSHHGYVAVKRKELIELGIADKISEYSFQKGDTVYLEEDGDASLFVKTKGLENIEFIERYHDGLSPITRYESYKR
jgi:hypothetical protein